MRKSDSGVKSNFQSIQLTQSTATIHVNQLGFRPDDPLKRAVMPVDVCATGFLGGIQFRVIQVSEFIKHALNSPGTLAAAHDFDATFEDTPLGRYAVCDFSQLTARGGYQVQYGPVRSYPFLIYRDAWKRCFPLLLEWYRIAACGEAVPGYHERCHRDDCQLPDGQPVDLVGGWHDAGDLRKWTSTMAYVSWHLAELASEHAGKLDQLGLDPDLVARQLQRGADYLRKTVDPRRHLPWHSVASADDNSCNTWEGPRLAETDTPALTAAAYIEAQCALARVLPAPESSIASALAVWQALADPAQWPCALALWRVTRREEFRQLVWNGLRELLDQQVTRADYRQDRLRGYFVRDGQIAGNAGFTGRGGRNVFEFIEHAGHLAQALLEWPTAPDAARWRDGLTLLLTGCIEPLLQLHPYRALPACIFARNETDRFGRPLAGDLCFRYFPAEAEGNNLWLANAGSRLALCARALGQPRWAVYGQKQLEWILGFNPHEESMMTGLGYSRAAVFSFYVGQIPGGVINGYTGTADDQPQLCRDREVAPMNMEYWSMNTATMLRALAVLENEPFG